MLCPGQGCGGAGSPGNAVKAGKAGNAEEVEVAVALCSASAVRPAGLAGLDMAQPQSFCRGTGKAISTCSTMANPSKAASKTQPVLRATRPV
jgi:hypothetical protein